MRVLVCGSRTWRHHRIIEAVVAGLREDAEAHGEPFVVIHGCARGADETAGDYAERAGIEVEPYPADWESHGRAAGPIRNALMLEEGRPDLVFAFVDRPLSDSKGTADMVRRAEAAGVPVYVIERRGGT